VPSGANSGSRLRLKGRGVKTRNGERGDQFVVVKLTLPQPIDEDLKTAIRGWSQSRNPNS
jgi:DnaJ-class molecular chaperone